MANTSLSHPIGPHEPPEAVLASDRAHLIEQIAVLPAALREAVEGLGDAQLDTPYREGGWTARQVVHHLADSHLNAYTRIRLALTEDVPTIRPYDEKAWAELHDARTLPAGVSLTLLEALHARWTDLLRHLTDEEWVRELDHPETGRWRLDVLMDHYAWHGRHHVAHISLLRERKGW